MILIKTNSSNTSQSGSALVYILVAIALLAALTASFMKPASQQTTAQQGFKTIANLKAQVEFVRSSIQQCVLTYPDGDIGYTGENAPYPINPSSAYLASPAADDALGNIRCPGDPGNSNDHAKIFGGLSGKFLPPAPDLFETWEYFNGDDGVFFYTSTNKTDAFLQSAMEKIDSQFSECEADIIDASSGQVEMTSTAAASEPKCVSGSTCFRVWVIATAAASGAYNGDTGGDEAACP